MAMVQATLAHVAVGCNAATNALSVRPSSSSTSSRSCNYCGAFAARNVVCLLRSSVDDDTNSAPMAIAETLKHRDATSDASRLTSVMMQYDAQSESVQVLAGDSDGRVFLWSKVSTSGWQLQKVTHESQKLPAVTVAAVTPAETHRRRLYFAAFSDGTLAVFGRGKGSEEEEEVKLLSRLELGVKSIMETMDALVVKGGEGEVEESVLLATGGVDSKVHLFEVADGSDQLTELLALEGHQGWIRSVAFKQQEKEDVGNVVAMLASASQDQRIRVWKVTARSRGQGEGASSGEVKDGFLARGARTTYTVSFDALLVGHEDWVTSVQWTQLPRDDESEDPCETALLSSSMDNTLIVWTKSADTRSSWTPSLRVGEMGGNGLLSAGVLPARGGRLNLLSLSFGGQLERWEQQPVPSKLFLPAISINGHCAEVTDLSWAPRGDYLVSVSLDQTARVVAPSKTSNDSLPNWFEISRAQVHGYDINCGCFVLGNRDANDQFVSGADEKILRVFEAPDEVRQLVGQLSPSDKNGGVQANAEKQVRSVQHAYLPELSLTNKSATTEESASDSDNGYAKLSSSLSLPVGDTLGRKTLWPEQRKLYGHGNELLCVTSSHTGDLIASACKSREERYAAVRLWNTADWSEAQLPLAGHKSSVVQLAFSPNDLYLLSVSRDRQFCLYERQPNSDGKFALVESVKAHRRIIWSCSWSPDSSLFALGSRDQSFSLWSRTSGKWGRICDPVAYDAAVTAVAFLPSALSNSGGYLLAVGLETGAIELFTMSKIDEDVAEVTCSRIDELAWEISPSGAVSRLEWCPAKNEGEFVLAAASSDSSVRVYNLKI
ncbi:hypothetical protein PHYSODRAFT_258381 [Phytophthora sojae]|uniref:Elongator complex protein 2 n=1 Tax=Phytophthora sojae (strain P6497) TaxID=1094619 RepID=G4YJP3_PHYSP|nr:hypothetical protein PHYSODRAFT_258381 [Phytophthora sojae]EGZ30155.1 hypothetical protein PHYSODRAFT_258381 [Phytophthora sojae]|eukprot:XP_009517430.1 hypothetical protein PHYSODRAFT_258381 [Phytophthora sojae]